MDNLDDNDKDIISEVAQIKSRHLTIAASANNHSNRNNFKFVSNYEPAHWKSKKNFEDDGEEESEGGWQQELQRRYAQEASFMAELRARHPTSPPEISQNAQSNQGYSMVQNFSHTNSGQICSNEINNDLVGQNHGQQNYVGQNYDSSQPIQNPGPFGMQPQHIEQTVNTPIKETEGNGSIETEATEEVQNENKSKEMLEWEEAVKRWINR